jgi:hypothetical protein
LERLLATYSLTPLSSRAGRFDRLLDTLGETASAGRAAPRQRARADVLASAAGSSSAIYFDDGDITAIA